MPTPIPQTEIDDFFRIVSAAPYPGGPIEADLLVPILVNYEDVFTAICRQLSLFATNNAYLTEALKVFDQTELLNAGIWNGQTYTNPPSSDPVAIINTTVTGVTPVSFTTQKYVVLLGSSSVDNIDIAAGFTVDEMYVGPNCSVGFVYAAKTDTIIKMVTLPFLRNMPSKLDAIEFGSVVNSINVETGSYFGGFMKSDPNQICAQPISGLTVGTVTHNTVPLTWTPPTTDYLFINNPIVTGKQIGRASCRERVSSPV